MLKKRLWDQALGSAAVCKRKWALWQQQQIIPHRTDECLCEKHMNELGGGGREGRHVREGETSANWEKTGEKRSKQASLALNGRKCICKCKQGEEWLRNKLPQNKFSKIRSFFLYKMQVEQMHKCVQQKIFSSAQMLNSLVGPSTLKCLRQTYSGKVKSTQKLLWKCLHEECSSGKEIHQWFVC